LSPCLLLNYVSVVFAMHTKNMLQKIGLCGILIL
jgi:hypothetical protein